MISVVGDSICDEYRAYSVAGPNPELDGGRKLTQIAPTGRVLGGAAAVANQIGRMGQRVLLSSVVGNDASGRWLCDELDVLGIGTHVFSSDSRLTTTKTRISIDGELHADRFDSEDNLDANASESLHLCRSPVGGVLVIQDYGKGLCTHNVCSWLIEKANARMVPVLVDPAIDVKWEKYEGCSLIKANLVEAREAARLPDAGMEELSQLLSCLHGCEVVVTSGEDGMAYCSKGGPVFTFPSIPTVVCDVCGAGDAVLASLAVSYLQGIPIDDACIRATHAASMQISLHRNPGWLLGSSLAK